MENNTTWPKKFDEQFSDLFGHGGEHLVKAFIATEIAHARADALKEAVAVVESKKDWPEPVEGAGEQIGPLAGVGMYMQYDADRKRHREELSEIIGQLTVLVGKTKDQ